jgi:hypothetical protein
MKKRKKKERALVLSIKTKFILLPELNIAGSHPTDD